MAEVEAELALLKNLEIESNYSSVAVELARTCSGACYRSTCTGLLF